MVTELQKYIQEFKHLRPFYYGDYYPLTGTENLYLDNKWLAYQLNRPGQSDGIIMAFRRKNCPDDSIRVELKGLNKMADYELFDEDSGKKVIKKGEELNNGFTLFLSEKQRSMLVNYKQVTN